VETGHVTPEFFATLGVQPRLGRSFAPEEDQPGRTGVAIVSDALWRGYFHADPRVLGKTITLDGAPRVVVGVMPPGFLYPGGETAGVWLPDAVGPEDAIPGRGMRIVSVIGRLKPGVVPEQARANLEGIAHQMDRVYRKPWSTYHAATTARVVSLREQLAEGSRTAIHVLLADVSLAPLEMYDPPRQVAFFRRVIEAIQPLPGVEEVAVSNATPLVPFNAVASGLAAEGEPESSETVCITSISAGYFRALRIPLVAGRPFDERDRESSPRVVVINQALARALFQDRDPVGRRIRYGDEKDKDPWVTVVAVVADMRHRALDDKVWPELFQPYTQAPAHWMSFVVRVSKDPAALAGAVRKAVRSIDRNQPLFDVRPLEARVSDSLATRRQRALLLGVFAVLSLGIAVLGVYGVMAYSVARRTHEIGLRQALGARQGDVVSMIVLEGLRMALLGLAIGLTGALALTRVLANFLYQLTPTDPLTFLGAGLALLAAACVASLLPARRATRVEPMAALRNN
jgi:hypothetical protein